MLFCNTEHRANSTLYPLYTGGESTCVSLRFYFNRTRPECLNVPYSPELAAAGPAKAKGNPDLQPYLDLAQVVALLPFHARMLRVGCSAVVRATNATHRSLVASCFRPVATVRVSLTQSLWNSAPLHVACFLAILLCAATRVFISAAEVPTDRAYAVCSWSWPHLC